MSHDAASPKKLIYMANQIGKFFAHKKHDEAIAGITNHLNRFWPPPMRRKIVGHLDQGGEGLDPLVREAVERVRATLPNEAEYSG